MSQDHSRLRSLTKRWYPKPPKKFVANLLISHVHQALFDHSSEPSQGELQLLRESKYFETVLWEYFHEDVSVSHIELVVVLLSYQLRREASRSVKTLRQDGHKFECLLYRILDITSRVYEESNFRLCRYIIQLLVLLSTSVSAIEPEISNRVSPLFDTTIWTHLEGYEDMLDSKFGRDEYGNIENTNKLLSDRNSKDYLQIKQKHGWIRNVINRIFSMVSEKPVSLSIQLFVEEIIHLFISIICSKSQIGETLGLFLQSTCFVEYFMIIGDGKFPYFGRTKSYLESLKNIAYAADAKINPEDEFDRLKESIQKINGGSKLFEIPTKFDITAKDLHRLLNEELKDKIHDVFTDFTGQDPKRFIHTIIDSEKGKSLDHEICIQSIVSLALYSEPELEDIYNFNESVYDTKLPTSVRPHIVPMVGLDSFDKYRVRSAQRIKSTVEQEISAHIYNVLERLSIDSNLNFKGSSKYFFQINEIKRIIGYDISVKLTKNFDIDTDRVVVLELVKPNKLAKFERVQKFGLNSIRLAKVTNADKKSLVLESASIAETDSFEDRLQYLIAIPSTETSVLLWSQLESSQFIHHPEIQQPSAIISGFEHTSDSSGRPNRDTKPSAKKLRDSNSKIISPNHELNQQQENIYNYMYSHKFTAIEYKSHTGINTMIRKAFTELRDERFITVVPSKDYLRTFGTSTRSPVNLSFIRYGIDDELDELKEMVASFLKLISSMFDSENGEVFNKNLSNLDYFEHEIKKLWNKYLHSNKDSLDSLLKNYPFPTLSGVTLDNFQDIINAYMHIIKSFEFTRQMMPVWLSTSKTNYEVWEYLYHNFNVVITLDDFAKMDQKAGTPSCDNLSIIQGRADALTVAVMQSNLELKQLVIIGGDLLKVFDPSPLHALHQMYGIRKEFVSIEDREDVDDTMLPVYNPGFKDTYQHIHAGDQVEEAEYCVLLFQYMRLIQYPASKIGIWVTSIRQKALIQEILVERCSKRNGGIKGFSFGTPGIIVGSEVEVSYDYAIISLFSESTSYTPVPGRLGNYFVGSFSDLNQLKLSVPPESKLHICTNETYTTKTDRTKGKNFKTFDTKNRFHEYVDRLISSYKP